MQSLIGPEQTWGIWALLLVAAALGLWAERTRIGASVNVAVVLKVGPVLFLFAGVILSMHLITIPIGGKLLHLSLPEILIASKPNMGGPTTAAMAAARR